MSENGNNKVEWLYGLEDYYKYSFKYEISFFIHQLINLATSPDPYPTLKKLSIEAHKISNPDWLFSKSMGFFINLIQNKHTLIEFASVARYYFENEKLFRIIHAYERNEKDINIISDALSRSQLKSKIWLIKELIPFKKHFDNVLIMAGWIGLLKPIYSNRLTYKKMRIIDIDKESCKVSDEIINGQDLQNYKVKSIHADINDLTCHKNGYELGVENFKTEEKFTEKFLPNLIINTSAEHMSEEWFHQIRNKNLESNPIVAIQSNNMFDIPEHLNCVYSIDHMKKKFPMTEVLYEGELQLKGYKRVMLIGRV
jgi:hypothetical protein